MVGEEITKMFEMLSAVKAHPELSDSPEFVAQLSSLKDKYLNHVIQLNSHENAEQPSRSIDKLRAFQMVAISVQNFINMIDWTKMKGKNRSTPDDYIEALCCIAQELGIQMNIQQKPETEQNS